MMNPYRSKSPSLFSNNQQQHDKKKQRQSLQQINALVEQQEVTSNKVRHRLSNLLFRTSSPVVTFINKRASMSSLSFNNTTTKATKHDFQEDEDEEEEEEEEDSQSITTTLSSSNSSDHMPASPKDILFVDNMQQQRTSWQPVTTILSFGQQDKQLVQQQEDSATTAKPCLLANQVQEILGSTLKEVDEEIDQDWEMSRDLLRRSLVSFPPRQQLIFS